MLGNEVTIKVLQGHFGHGDPLLGVVTHGEAGALASHCHDVPAKGNNQSVPLTRIHFAIQVNLAFFFLEI